MKLYLFLPAALLLAACSTASNYSADRTGTTIANGDPGYISSAPVIQITDKGLGPVGTGTPYGANSLQAALPGFSFDTVQTATGAEVTWLLTAFKDGQQQAQFEADASKKYVARVHVVGQEAAGPNGERLGMTFAQTGGKSRSCKPGHAEWIGMALCSDGALTYVYAPPAYDNADGGLPPRETLAQSRLVRIIWTAG